MRWLLVVTPMTVMATMTTKGNVKSKRRPVMMMAVMMVMIVRRRRDEKRLGIKDRCRLINDRCGLIDDRLLHDYVPNDRRGLRIDDGGLLDDDLAHHGRGLMDDHGGRLVHHDRGGLINDGCGLNVNRRRRINANWLGLEGLGQQEAGANSCHDFAGDSPFLIASLDARSGSADEGQGCDCH